MNLVIDIGNTRIKAALFKNGELISNKTFTNKAHLEDFIDDVTAEKAIICNVGKEKYSLPDHFPYIELSHQTKVPLHNQYGTPETLGKDRLAASVGAISEFSENPVLVVDAGTCITLDFTDQEKRYYGGSIHPGLIMRYKALYNFTGKLPLVTPVKEVSLTGSNTKESILSGVQNGITMEIDGMIQEYRHKYPGLIVLLTGGDTNFFESKLKEPIFVRPDLVLKGLNRILVYNEAIFNL